MLLALLDLEIGLWNHRAVARATCESTLFHNLLVVVDLTVTQKDHGLPVALVDERLIGAHGRVDNGEPMESDDELGEHLEGGVIRATMLHAHEVLIHASELLVVPFLTESDDGENTTHSSLESRGRPLHPDTKCDYAVLRSECTALCDYYVESK